VIVKVKSVCKSVWKKLKQVWVVLVIVALGSVMLTACTPEGEIIPELQGPVSVLIQGLVELLLVPLLLMAVAWMYAKARTAWQRYKDTHREESYWISYVINKVVMAAEQMAAAYPELITDKKAWAIEKAEAWLQKYGLDVDVDQIAVMIEAEVKALFNPDPDEPLSPAGGTTD
jgi:hypothetical protein